jgi:dTDP-4-dehydrorhamnose reductase
MLRRLAIERIDGVVHVTNQGATTWYGFVREIAVAAGRDPDRVVPIRTAELVPPRPARRPANSVLDNAVLRSRDIPLLRPFDEALRELVATLVR